MYFLSESFYHIYNRGNNRERIFFQYRNYNYFKEKLKKYLLPFVDVISWCLMPNHFHGIIEIKSDVRKDAQFVHPKTKRTPESVVPTKKTNGSMKKRKSHRLQGFDYSQNGCYYITICTKNKKHYFGFVENEKMHLNCIGEIANKFWREIPNHFENVDLGEFVVMPNHIHGVIEIENNVCRDAQIVRPKIGRTPESVVPTGWQKGCLGVVLNQFKRKCTIEIRKTNSLFTWQPRFYDHIIRNENSFEKITDYIICNPAKWEDDEYNISTKNQN